ncbi:MAG: DUF3108 domain-containing protein [Chloroherpetonaceae bacterium]|jgi:hypothetical protein|nr:DUF3108 domain-containing protein [bacterium]
MNRTVLGFASFLCIFTFCNLNSVNLYTQTNPKSYLVSDNSTINTSNDGFRYLPNESFGFGERLEYKVGYKFITAGTGFLQIMPEPVFRNGRPCYDIRFGVKSLPALDYLYKVRDAYSTIMDVGGLFSWEFNQQIREGKYRRDEQAIFDQGKNLVYTRGNTYKVPPYSYDIMSAFYYVRSLNLSSMPKGTIFYLNNFFKDTTYQLGVRIHGKTTEEVDVGKFRCILIEPLVVEGGLFKSEGSIYIWLTDDDRKVPIKVAAKIPIGFVEAKLTSYRGLRGPITAKIPK